MSSIEAKGVSKSVGGKHILTGIDFKIPSGKVLNIVGRSGAGKSMLLKCLNRLVEPTGGDVLVDGESFKEMDPIALRRKVGMVFQEPVMFKGLVWENLLYGLDMDAAVDQDIHSEAAKRKIYSKHKMEMEMLMDHVGLKQSFLNRNASKLSGGEKQRVAIARALGADPGVLLLDEPTSALDPKAQKHIERLVLKLNRDLGITIIIVTHDAQQALRLGDKTLQLKRGRVKWCGPTRSFGGGSNG